MIKYMVIRHKKLLIYIKVFIIYAYKIRTKVNLAIFKIFLFIMKIKFLLYTTFVHMGGWFGQLGFENVES
jgi:hypothetical protein